MMPYLHDMDENLIHKVNIHYYNIHDCYRVKKILINFHYFFTMSPSGEMVECGILEMSMEVTSY